jgi:hypothetical protein
MPVCLVLTGITPGLPARGQHRQGGQQQNTGRAHELRPRRCTRRGRGSLAMAKSTAAPNGSWKETDVQAAWFELRRSTAMPSGRIKRHRIAEQGRLLSMEVLHRR